VRRSRGILEDVFGVAGLDQTAHVEEGGALRHARGLGHRVGDDDDAEPLAQFVDQFLDARGGDGVQGRAGLVHQDDFGVHGDGAGDDQTLLLATRQTHGRGLQAVSDLFPQAGALQRAFDHARPSRPWR
jgi:hypothetical protein